MVPHVVRFSIKEGKMDEAIEMMKAMEAEVAKEAGTILYKFCRDIKKPNVLVLMELYENQDAFQAHLSTPHLKEFLGKFPSLIDGKAESMYLEEISSK